MFSLHEAQIQAFAAAAARRARRGLQGELAAHGLESEARADRSEITIRDREGRVARLRFGEAALAVTAPSGRHYGFGYDAQDRLCTLDQAAGRAASIERDAQGLIRRVTRSDGSAFTFDYDEQGDIRALGFPDGGACAFQHDDHGRIVGYQDCAGRSRYYDYAEFGGLARVDLGPGKQILYGYDEEGELETLDEPGRPRVEFVADPADRSVAMRRGGREQVRWCVGESVAEFTQQCSDGAWTRLCFESGQLVTAETAETALRLDYDGAGRLVAETCDGATILYERDGDGALAALVTPAGERIAYLRDADGRLEGVRDARGRTYGLRHAPSGALAEIVYPNGVTLTRASNALGLIEGMELAAHGESLLACRWRYDRRDRLCDETLPDGTRRSFVYDADGWLLGVESATAALRETFTLDPYGNCVEANGVAARFDLADQICERGAARFEHDDNGCAARHALASGTAALRHDGQSRLAEARIGSTEARYRYDPIGRRIAKELVDHEGRLVATTRYRWAGCQLLSETIEAADGTIEQRDYLPVPDLGIHLAQRVDGRHYCLHHGRRLEVLAMTDSRGRVAWAGDYSAFGELRLRTSHVAQPFRLMGQYHDAETGLHYSVARYYDPVLGRFLERDPLGFRGGSWNDYVYCDGDPVNRADPTGEFLPILLAGAGIGAAIGGGVEVYRQHKANPDAPIDWGKVGKEAAMGGAIGTIGAGVGLLLAPLAGLLGAGLAAGIAGGGIVGGIEGVVQACAQARLRGTAITPGDLLNAGLLGAGIGALTGGIGGWLAGPARRAAKTVASAENRTIMSTSRGVALTPELRSLQGTSKSVGDFKGIKGATVEEIVSRTPRDWTPLTQRNGEGIKFIDQAGEERVRIHGPDANPNLPPDSNSRNGWVVRVHAPGTKDKYYDNLGNVVGRKANDGHIPIHGNPMAGK